MTITFTTFRDLLEQRRDAAIARANQIAERFTSHTSAPLSEQVEFEQAIDDVDRYARMANLIGAGEARTPTVYRAGGASFIADLIAPHETESRARLATCRFESRSVGTAAFAGLVPPQYLTDLASPGVREARPLADLLTRPLPDHGLSVVSSRLTTQATATEQTTQNTNVSSTDLVFTSITNTIRTISHRVVVSRQAIERGFDVDLAIIRELSEAIASKVDAVLVAEILAVSGATAKTYTDVSATAPELRGALAGGASTAAIARQRSIDTWVMHPRRWWWYQSSADQSTDVAGRQILTLPVVLDANIPTNLGVGTNEDAVIGLRSSDLALYESPIFVAMDHQSAAASGTVTIVAYQYIAPVIGQYPSGVLLVTGSGLNAVAA